MASDQSALSVVSATSYHLNASGLLQPCDANYPACTWRGDVEAFNAAVPGATAGGVGAAPLLFNNAGSTVAWFRAMVAGGRVGAVVAQLAAAAAAGGCVYIYIYF
jgi:hypothetical protein